MAVEAQSMPDLKAKVMSGQPPMFDTQCSGALKNLCLSMISYDQPRRPALTELLRVPQERLGSVPGAKESGRGGMPQTQITPWYKRI